jgi:hypothetical protein
MVCCFDQLSRRSASFIYSTVTLEVVSPTPKLMPPWGCCTSLSSTKPPMLYVG